MKSMIPRRLSPRVAALVAAAAMGAASVSAQAAWLVPADIQADITGIGTSVSLWVAAGAAVSIGAFGTGFGWNAMVGMVKGAFKKAFG